MPRQSAGVLLHRARPGWPREVLIGHPGGPFWERRDDGAWSVPKGEQEPDEDPWDAARREFAEEVGIPVPEIPPLDLGVVRQRSGKLVRVYAVEADLDVRRARSNLFEMEWPPHSGRMASFPELDRVAWYEVDVARRKLSPRQAPFLDRLEQALAPTVE